MLKGMTGDLETCMAGMNCGTPSDYGWNALKDNATVFLSCKDELAFDGMKRLNKPQGNKHRICVLKLAKAENVSKKPCRCQRIG